MKKNIGIKIWIVSLVIILLVPSQIVLGATTTFEFNQEKVRVKEGMPFSLKLKGKWLTDLYGFEVALSFDESKLEMISKPSVDFAAGFSAGPTRDNDGKVYFGFTKIGVKSGENGTLTLGEFQFKAKEPGVHTIKLESVKVVDSKGSSKHSQVGQTIQVKVVGKGESVDHKDIKGHWAESCIRQIVDQGYMIGKSDALFKPNELLTRAEMAVILTNIMEEYEVENNVSEEIRVSAFKDIKGEEWYTGNILKMASRGFLNGYEDDTFKPQQPITRGEVLSVLARIEKENGTYKEPEAIEKILASYKDAKKVPTWARVDMAWAIEIGLIMGNEKAELNSQGNISRAEIAVILCRYLQLEAHE